MKKVLQKFNINDDMKSISTLLAPHFKLKAPMSPTFFEECEYMTHVPYTSAVDSLTYTMVYTGPDLSHVVLIVSRYMHVPGRGQWEIVKWILWYIKSTIDFSLVLKKDSTGKQECAG